MSTSPSTDFRISLRRAGELESLEALLAGAPSFWTQPTTRGRSTEIPDGLSATVDMTHQANQSEDISFRQRQDAERRFQEMEAQVRAVERQLEQHRENLRQQQEQLAEVRRQAQECRSSWRADCLCLSYWSGQMEARDNMVTAQQNLVNDMTKLVTETEKNIQQSRTELTRSRQLETERQETLERARDAFNSGDRTTAEDLAREADRLAAQTTTALQSSFRTLTREVEIDWEKHQEALRRASERWEEAEKTHQKVVGCLKIAQKVLIIGAAAAITALTGGVGGILLGIAVGSALCGGVNCLNVQAGIMTKEEAWADWKSTTVEICLTCVGAGWASAGARAASGAKALATLGSNATRLQRIGQGARMFYHAGKAGLKGQLLSTVYHGYQDIQQARKLAAEQGKPLEMEQVMRILAAKAGELSLAVCTAGVGARFSAFRAGLRMPTAAPAAATAATTTAATTAAATATRTLTQRTLAGARAVAALGGLVTTVPGAVIGGVTRSFLLVKSYALEAVWNVIQAEANLIMTGAILQREITEDDRLRAYCAATVGSVNGICVEKIQSSKQRLAFLAEQEVQARANAAQPDLAEKMCCSTTALSGPDPVVAGPTQQGGARTASIGGDPNQFHNRTATVELDTLHRAHLEADAVQGGPLSKSSEPHVTAVTESAQAMVAGRSTTYAERFVASVVNRFKRAAGYATEIPAPGTDPQAAAAAHRRMAALVADDTDAYYGDWRRGVSDDLGPLQAITVPFGRFRAAVARPLNATLDAVPKLWNKVITSRPAKLLGIGKLLHATERFATLHGPLSVLNDAVHLFGTWGMDRFGGPLMLGTLLIAGTQKTAQVGRAVSRFLGWQRPNDAGNAFARRTEIEHLLRLGQDLEANHGIVFDPALRKRLETAWSQTNKVFNASHRSLVGRAGAVLEDGVRVATSWRIPGTQFRPMRIIGKPLEVVGYGLQHLGRIPVVGTGLKQAGEYVAHWGRMTGDWQRPWATSSHFGTFSRGPERQLAAVFNTGLDAQHGFNRLQMMHSLEDYLFRGITNPEGKISTENFSAALAALYGPGVPDNIRAQILGRLQAYTTPPSAGPTPGPIGNPIAAARASRNRRARQTTIDEPQVDLGGRSPISPRRLAQPEIRERVELLSRAPADLGKPRDVYDIHLEQTRHACRNGLDRIASGARPIEDFTRLLALYEANGKPEDVRNFLLGVDDTTRPGIRQTAAAQGRDDVCQLIDLHIARLDREVLLPQRITAILEGRTPPVASSPAVSAAARPSTTGPVPGRVAQMLAARRAQQRAAAPAAEPEPIVPLAERDRRTVQQQVLDELAASGLPLERQLQVLNQVTKSLNEDVQTSVTSQIAAVVSKPPGFRWWPFGVNAKVRGLVHDVTQNAGIKPDGKLADMPDVAAIIRNPAELPSSGGYFSMLRFWEGGPSASRLRYQAQLASERGTFSPADTNRIVRELIANPNDPAHSSMTSRWTITGWRVRHQAAIAGNPTATAYARAMAQQRLTDLVDQPRRQVADAVETVHKRGKEAYETLEKGFKEADRRIDPLVRERIQQKDLIADLRTQLAGDLPPEVRQGWLGGVQVAASPTRPAPGPGELPRVSAWDTPTESAVFAGQRDPRTIALGISRDIPEVAAMGYTRNNNWSNWRTWMYGGDMTFGQWWRGGLKRAFNYT